MTALNRAMRVPARRSRCVLLGARQAAGAGRAPTPCAPVARSQAGTPSVLEPVRASVKYSVFTLEQSATASSSISRRPGVRARLSHAGSAGPVMACARAAPGQGDRARDRAARHHCDACGQLAGESRRLSAAHRAPASTRGTGCGSELSTQRRQRAARCPRPTSRRRGASRVQPGRPGRDGRDIVVAVDAGHGGQDPGAHRPRRHARKGRDARDRARARPRHRREDGMRAVLIRDGDGSSTCASASAGRASTAPTCSSRSTPIRCATAASRGSSVYVLSTAAPRARRRAGWPIARTPPMLKGGVSLDDKDDRAGLGAARCHADGDHGRRASRRPTRAERARRVGAVRKRACSTRASSCSSRPDIPSMLVETAYISNPAEERRLRNSALPAAPRRGDRFRRRSLLPRSIRRTARTTRRAARGPAAPPWPTTPACRLRSL